VSVFQNNNFKQKEFIPRLFKGRGKGKSVFQKKGDGFTLIELLIVTVILAVMLSVIFIFVNQARIKSRDAARENGIKQLQVALGLYANNKGFYPVCDPEIRINGVSDCLSVALLAELAVRGSSQTDPLNTAGVCGESNVYVYCYWSATGSTYTIRYNLETNSILGKSAGWQNVNP